MAKKPKQAFRPSKKKQPQGEPPKPKEGPVSWRFRRMDMGGEWPCSAIDASTLLDVREKLTHFEKQKWSASAGSGSAGVVKRIPIADFQPSVQQRFTKLGLDHLADALWEFRLGGKPRVWGVRVDDVCYIVWWDPHHSVYPSKKKRT